MSRSFARKHHDLLSFVGDGALISAGVFSLMMGAAFGLHSLGVAPLGTPQDSFVEYLLSGVSWLLQTGGFVVGPALVWLLHRRGFTKWPLVALFIGYLLGGVFVVPVLLAAMLTEWLLGLVSHSQSVGLVAYLAFSLLTFLAVIGWLDSDAIKDLGHGHREHVALSVVRLVASASVAVFVAMVVSLAITGQDVLEALAFQLLAAVQGAGVVFVGHAVHRLITTKHAKPQSASSAPGL